jgi:hypothetical protein
MNGIFVDEGDEVKIEFYVGRDADSNLVASEKESDLHSPGAVIEKHSMVFRRPSFKDTVAISGSTSVSLIGAGIEFSPLRVRMARMTHLIKSWTFVDDKGNPVPPTEENISKLSPLVANLAGMLLETAIGSEF